MDDHTLFKRAREGDEDAFAELFARHQRPLFRYAAYMCGAAADDVVQETFLAVLRQRDRRDDVGEVTLSRTALPVGRGTVF